MRQKRACISQWLYFCSFLCSICVSLFLLVIPFLSGCAFSTLGKADVTPFRIKAPEGLVGLSKSQIIDRLGLPEGVIADENGVEYWAYNNTNQYYIVVYGQGGYKMLILKMEDNAVTAVRLINKGASTNILAGGM